MRPNHETQPAGEVARRAIPRRELLKTAGRAGVLFVLAAFGLWQEAKRRSLVDDPTCVKLDPCSTCSAFVSCLKPKARDARQIR